jgi:alpha-tubulin suppressor-like RCC1 family protein
VLQSGSVRCWGTNANGQLGRGDGDLSVNEGTIPGIGPALQVAVGTQHACALSVDGTVSCWGSGYLGNGAGFEVTQAPRAVNGLTGIVELTAGYDATCALRGDGAVLCWGDNASGTAGIGAPGAAVLVPTPTLAGAAFWH